jgi:hypothetical protein
MAGRALARVDGICGLLYVVLMIPAYVVGYPDAPDSAAEVSSYFDTGRDAFVFFNGVLALFSTFFFLWFLGGLHRLLRRAEGQKGGLATVALVGGLVFITLSCVGYAVEISYPATLVRFGDYEQNAQFVLESLALSSWLYHFCQIGASVLVIATSRAALGTGVLLRVLASAGFVVALLTLLHFLVPLLGALVVLLWIAAVSALMVAGLVGTSTTRTRTVRHKD